MASTFWAPRSPRRMIEPRPNCFSIWRMAASTARPRSPFFSARDWLTATGASIWTFRSSVVAGAPVTVGSLLFLGLARLAFRLDDLDLTGWRLVARHDHSARAGVNFRGPLLGLALGLSPRS